MPGRSALAVPCFCLTFGRTEFKSISLMAALELDNVSLAYGNFPAVRDFSLQIRAGDLVSLLGPSGSGKTTILRLIAGLERPESGTVHLRGQEMVSKRKFVPPEQNAASGSFFKTMRFFRTSRSPEISLLGSRPRGAAEPSKPSSLEPKLCWLLFR